MARFLLLLPLFFCAVGCERSDADRLARIGRKVGTKVEGLIPDRTPFAAPLAIPGTERLDLRVKERIRSDKYLAQYSIEVVVEGKTVRLQGAVADEVSKRRAIELAESTTGVEEVICELTLNHG